jgi:hypothetical protein
MLSAECLSELRSVWLPHLTDSGLTRLLDLLEKGSPLLISGCFTGVVPMGCLASHAAWQHPATAHLSVEAGITWLHQVAGLNPATSLVLREWDLRGAADLGLRTDLVAELRDEQTRRQRRPATARRAARRQRAGEGAGS